MTEPLRTEFIDPPSTATEPSVDDRTGVFNPNETSATLHQAAPTPTATPTLPDREFGNYELLDEIARGGMGVVYKARQKGLNRVVALKMILDGQLTSETATQRFYQEAQAAAALDHPNIVAIYEIGQQTGRHFFTMAFVEGASLSARVKTLGLPPAAEAAALALGVADAVAFAHRHGIIHRDLKPDNVLIDGQGRPRVTDFGLAKRLDCDANLTASGSIVGTPSYMAPEQAKGGSSAPIGPAADVYAVGGILYFLLTGQPPFSGTSFGEVLFKVVQDPVTPPSAINPAVPPEIEALCLKCLAKSPDDRPESAGAVADGLRSWLSANAPSMQLGSWSSGVAGAGTTQPLPTQVKGAPAPTQTAMPATPPARKLPWAAVAVAALGGVAVAAVAVLVFKPWLAPSDDKQVPSLTIADAGLREALTPAGQNDFNLRVEMLEATPEANGVMSLVEGQALGFKISVDKEAYVSVWTVDDKGEVTRLFPNIHEKDAKVMPDKPRVVPSEGYSMLATPSEGVERVLAMASTRPMPEVEGGQQMGNVIVFKNAKEKEQWQRAVLGIRQERGIKLVSGEAGAPPSFAEAVLPYHVKAKK